MPFVALGLVMCWGHGGILSLGQGVFFGLGGYCMAMFLSSKLRTPAHTSIQSTPGIPDFMDWNQITKLPLLWVPFKSLPLALLAILVVPGHLPSCWAARCSSDGWAACTFAIITQAVCGHPIHPDHRSPGLHRRRQRHYRPPNASRLGHQEPIPRRCPLFT